MKIEEWRPIEHWNEVFGLELSRVDLARLARICKTFGADSRFTNASGCATVYDWRESGRQTLFSPSIPRCVVEIARRIPDNLEDFVRAARNIGKEYYFHAVDDLTDLTDFSHQWKAMNLPKGQEEYARKVYEAIEFVAGFDNTTVPGLGAFDNTLFLMSSEIARQRHAERGDKPVRKRRQLPVGALSKS